MWLKSELISVYLGLGNDVADTWQIKLVGLKSDQLIFFLKIN